MLLPIPCGLAAWCLSPQPSKERWSSRSSAERSRSGSSEPRPPEPSIGAAAAGPSMVRAAPRVGARLAACCYPARGAETGGGEPLINAAGPSGVLRCLRDGCLRHASLRPSGSPPPGSSPPVTWPQAQGGQCTRIQPRQVEHWKLCSDELAGFCGCPVAALGFSRVGQVHLAHGDAWARLEALNSLRWPFLDVPVIHGPAVAVRPVLGSGGVDRPGQDPGGRGALAWRALDPWEAENGLWVLRRHVLPMEPLSGPMNQACLNSIG